MDDKRERFINWIGVSLSLPEDRLTEIFYFDKKTNLFFTIHVADYFMLNEDFEVDEAVTTSYNKKTEDEIVTWIKRIENEDKQIIRVPQKGLTDKTLKRIEAKNFLNGLSIEMDELQIWEIEESTSVKIDLTKEQQNSPDKKWWELWK
ncbi:hypothetical protein ATO12_03695 [Aquimarina atlantica]|uniref:Uncharacterized protein n=1 Tax=Aquimarina atlantica TaxID=1317122 RepID=A0A023C0R5_9FLAO|nr:hypothetical protein [Aquimarina atlantica]EZH75906.1 hypothetical protein ATO12_03695 [Aquimarina atlantica]